jgi:hypothetical protein
LISWTSGSGVPPAPSTDHSANVLHPSAPIGPSCAVNRSLLPSSGFTTVDVRYWSMCEADLARPVPTVACTTDVTTAVVDGYYTTVISDDLLRPDWLDPDTN